MTLIAPWKVIGPYPTRTASERISANRSDPWWRLFAGMVVQCDMPIHSGRIITLEWYAGAIWCGDGVVRIVDGSTFRFTTKTRRSHPSSAQRSPVYLNLFPTFSTYAWVIRSIFVALNCLAFSLVPHRALCTGNTFFQSSRCHMSLLWKVIMCSLTCLQDILIVFKVRDGVSRIWWLSLLSIDDLC